MGNGLQRDMASLVARASEPFTFWRLRPARSHLVSGMASSANLQAFAVTAPGLEPVAAREARALGLPAVRETAGGVSFSGSSRDLVRANLHLRTASRVVVRIAEFQAEAFYDLERRSARVPWADYLATGGSFRVRATCRKSRLYHSDAVAERVGSAIVARTGAKPAARGGTGEESGEDTALDDQLIVVRLFRDRCTISVDSSGALLHRRGYRQATAKAPIRETVAAAALLCGGWTGAAPLLDPMCGAGTIPIEGALIARRIAPGLGRRFAFERWPSFEAAVWAEARAEAEGMILAAAGAPIQGSDRDEGAVAAAAANAARAGVAADIELSRRAISAIDPPPEPGWLVTNPPYGVRVGERDRLRNLYAQLGKVVRAKCAGWSVVMISADSELDRQVGIPLRPVVVTSNGGIPVQIVLGQTPRFGSE